MIFGMIMAKHLGMAAHNRAIGKGGIAKEYILAVVIPIVIHSLFDATNGTSLLLESSDEFQQMLGIILSVAGAIALFVLQIVIIVRFKKKMEEYCSLKTS